MKKYFICGALVVAFAAPALAADYYVALRLGGGAAKCEVMTTEPDTKTYQDDGQVQFRGGRESSHGYHERVRRLVPEHPILARGNSLVGGRRRPCTGHFVCPCSHYRLAAVQRHRLEALRTGLSYGAARRAV